MSEARAGVPVASGGDGRDPPGGAAAQPTWRAVVVIAVGVFVSGFGWPGIIGRLPFGLLLKNEMHLPPERVALFWAIGTAAWYVKPLVALVCDAVPLFGTRRRGYLLVGGTMGALAWAAYAVIPRRYAWFLALMVALNVALVVVSATVGGMLVEEGQRSRSTGRLSALRSALEGAMSLLGGPLGGLLAVAGIVVTSGAGALTLALLVPVTLLWHREPRRAHVDRALLATTAAQLRTIVRSRPMWATSALLFLVYLSPGLQTPLLYYQQDVLKLDARFMGILQFAGGAGVLAGAAVYAWACRRLPLRLTLIAGIVVSGLAALLYNWYGSATAALIVETIVGFVVTVGTLPLYDLAARATPAGSESFGYSLMMTVRNVAVFGISDLLGSKLYGSYHLSLAQLAWVNAGSTLAVLLFVPFLPKALLGAREGRP